MTYINASHVALNGRECRPPRVAIRSKGLKLKRPLLIIRFMNLD